MSRFFLISALLLGFVWIPAAQADESKGNLFELPVGGVLLDKTHNPPVMVTITKCNPIRRFITITTWREKDPQEMHEGDTRTFFEDKTGLRTVTLLTAKNCNRLVFLTNPAN